MHILATTISWGSIPPWKKYLAIRNRGYTDLIVACVSRLCLCSPIYKSLRVICQTGMHSFFVPYISTLDLMLISEMPITNFLTTSSEKLYKLEKLSCVGDEVAVQYSSYAVTRCSEQEGVLSGYLAKIQAPGSWRFPYTKNQKGR